MLASTMIAIIDFLLGEHMFIATTPTPKQAITKDEAIGDFLHLISRACEYVRELETLDKLRAGSYMPLYEDVASRIKSNLDENWKNE